jgi:hypothetical protein
MLCVDQLPEFLYSAAGNFVQGLLVLLFRRKGWLGHEESGRGWFAAAVGALAVFTVGFLLLVLLFTDLLALPKTIDAWAGDHGRDVRVATVAVLWAGFALAVLRPRGGGILLVLVLGAALGFGGGWLMESLERVPEEFKVRADKAWEKIVPLGRKFEESCDEAEEQIADDDEDDATDAHEEATEYYRAILDLWHGFRWELLKYTPSEQSAAVKFLRPRQDQIDRWTGRKRKISDQIREMLLK